MLPVLYRELFRQLACFQLHSGFSRLVNDDRDVLLDVLIPFMQSWSDA